MSRGKAAELMPRVKEVEVMIAGKPVKGYTSESTITLGSPIKQGFSYIALKKLNSMINDCRYVQIVSVDEDGILIRNENSSFQLINKFGTVHNSD